MIRFSDVLLILLSIVGWVIAKGFWQTLIAVIIPPYAWYLAIEYFLRTLEWVV
jgi:uncharacterized membrane protein YqaE (UPF0057 family)